MMNVKTLFRYIIAFLVILFALASNGFAQMPSPTPTQTPTVPNMTYDEDLAIEDDFFVYTKNDRSPQVFYPWLNAGSNPEAMEEVLTSQTYSIGSMTQTTCGFGYCPPNSAIGYKNVLPGNIPGASSGFDTGSYYTIRYNGVQWTFSKLATITIIAKPEDDGENAGESCPVVGQPVNITNGNMWLEQTDFSLPGIGERIEIKRFYNSIIQTSGMFGRGWATKYDESLQIIGNASLIRLNTPDGRAVFFTRKDANSPYLPFTPGLYAFIENADGGYTLTFKNGWKHHFNSLGLLQWQKDRNGNQTTLHYDQNILTHITDANGNTLTFNISGGLVQSIVHNSVVIATYTYWDQTPNLKEVTYQDGSKYKFTYNTTAVSGKTFLETVKDANDKILETHEYDGNGRATTSEKEGGVEKYIFDYSNWSASAPYTLVKHKKNASDPNFIETKYYFDKWAGRNFIKKTEGNCNCGGGTEETIFEYDNKLNLKKKTERIAANEWRDTEYTYNYQGDVLTQTEKFGTVTFGTMTYTYNPYGQVLTMTDRMGGTWTRTYDANGNLQTVKDPLDKITTLTYPTTNKGLPASVIDARQNETKFVWNAKNLLQETEDPYQKKTTYTYDARGRIKTVTNALNHTTTYNYFDDAQRKIEVIYPNNDKITYKYDVRRLLESVTDERGKITTYTFDDAYRLTRVTDPLGHFKEYGYDLMSNPTSFKDALGNVTDYKYDDFDRLTEIEYPAASVGATRLKVNYTYDDLGRIKTMTDTAGRVTTYNYLDAQRKNEIINAENEKTTIEYNQRFQTVKVTDAKNQAYTFTHDPLGRMLSQTRAGGTMTFEYDAVGNRKKRVDYLGRVTNYKYDKLNRLEKIEYGVIVGQQATVTYGYDSISRLTSATNEAGTVSINYDSRSRIINTTDVFGHLVEYEYLLTTTENKRRLKLDGANYADYKYDDAYRLEKIINLPDGAEINFGYDNADRLTSRTYPNGVSTEYEYDGMSRLKRLKDVSTSATLFDRQYDYNTASQINQIAEPTQTRTFGYDNVDRLTSMTNGTANESYSFDDVGNRTSSHRSATYTYQSGQFNRVASTATANYTYDANGNLTSKAEGSKRWIYFWDYENRLTMAWDRKQRVRYLYDALGRRVQRFIVGNKENTKFIYDGEDVLVDDNSGTLTKYLNGDGIDNKLRVQTGNDVKYFLADHLGSTNGLTDASGNLTEQTSYDSFGNATNNLATRYQFTGREYDNFTGLHYYRARFYDANLGRFISEDPIGFAGQDINLYGYVWNNPLTFRDPSGKIVPLIVGGIVIGGLILASPSTINAPGPGDPIYYPDNPLILNAAGGAVCGALWAKFGSPLLSRILAGTGDDIIELGVGAGRGGLSPSQVPPPPPPPPSVKTPNFLGQENGPAIPVPQGASQTPIINPSGKTTGYGYTGGSGGGNGLNPRVTSVRVMDPTLPKGPSPGYPNGYVNYMNKGGQAVNPYTGQTIPKNSPWWHIPLD